MSSTDDSGYSPIKGVDYFDGTSGDDGREIELRKYEDYIQWHYVGDSKWYNLVSLEEIKGEPGEPGEQGPEGLRGPKGEQGLTGPAGPEGRKIELRLSGDNLQWGYSDDDKWYNLLPVSKLIGPQGPEGKPGKDGKDGLQGPRGMDGLPGPAGPTGEQGPEGKRGLRGEPGAPGKNGINGKDGADGKRGPAGPAGPEGKRGPKGPKGDKGDKPVLGVDYFIQPGPAGRDGKNGKDGIDGVGGGDAVIEGSTYTYVDGVVTRIDYESGQYKEFSYNLDGSVSQLVWHRTTDVVTKDFTYNGDGTVASITVTIT